MTDRRRNFFILAFVAALLLASIGVIATKQTRLGLDLKGGVELVYEAKPTKFAPVVDEGAINRSLEVMRERVDKLGVAEPELQRSGENQLVVSLPGAKDAEEAENQVGTTAQLFFYDWEPNVVGKSGKPEPNDISVTGGPQAGSTGCLPQYDALARARRRPAMPKQSTTTTGSFYVVDDKARKVVAGPQESEDAVVSILETERLSASQRIVKVNEGTIVVQAEGVQLPNGEQSDAERDCFFVLNDDFALRGTDLKNPEQQFDSGPGGSGAPNVSFEFTDRGKDIWQDVTRGIVQRGQAFFPTDGQQLDTQSKFQHFAIVLDGKLISTPFIDYTQNPDGIDGVNGSQISGGFTIKSAQRLASLLQTGALPVRLELISRSQVSATLGQEALDQGVIAAAVGFFIVAAFLLAFYRLLGLIAVVALGVYALYFFALIKLIPITLTLPGIAGLVLTIGVTADANIVIFERVKEEVRAGRSVPAAIAQGYKKGIAAIIDANVVIFMVAFILFTLATAGVKGFAFVLGIGTLVTLLTAVLFTQAVFGTMGRSQLLQSPSALGQSRDGPKERRWRIDFMGLSKWFFSASGIILLIGAFGIAGKGIDFGIDFESGTRIRAAFTEKTDESKIRTVLETQGLEGAEIQRVNDPALGGDGSNGFQISAGQLEPQKVSAVVDALDDEFKTINEPDAQSIGPTFGETVASQAVIAIIASLIVISAYIALRFEWKYAVPVLIALMHDILLTAGVYALADREVTTSTVAALLTLLGFSLYDTIIVFDRIRENVPRMPSATFSQVVNRSMNEVLTRSLATSFCTALPILALLVLGGETLQDFAFALIVGIISGTYSSLFIAGPVLTHWKEREPVYRRRTARMLEHFGTVPTFAVAIPGGAPVDVAPKEDRRPRERLTAPGDPAQGVSKAEFDAMVRDLPVDAIAPPDAPEFDPRADALPEDTVMKDDRKQRDKSGRKPNKRHGRPR